MIRRTAILTVLLVALLALAAGVSAQDDPVKDPLTAENVYAAWQPFENGVMMWFQDTRQIWVFYDPSEENESGQILYIYDDEYTEGSDSVPSTGDCGIVPKRGFGTIWYNHVGASLGCPLVDREIGFDTAARRQVGDSLQIQGPGMTLYSVTIQPGASTGTWRTERYY
jgi:hypothetical protein